jgi:glycosyltransferase involved in cell wall biosynthesis
MKKEVMWISSYLPRSCGIAYYSKDYITALEKYAKSKKIDLNIKILSHTDATQADYPIIPVNQNKRINDRRWHKKVVKKVKKEKPDIVHIQHEYGLYETYKDCNKRVIKLIKELKKEVPVVMTYHSVYKKLEGCHKDFVSKSLKLLNAGIVHEEYQKENLPKNLCWSPSNVFVLPHGSREDINFDREKVRDGFDYNNEMIVGAAGLADKRKGFLTLIEQWPKVVKKVPNAKLVLELKPHFDKKTREYIDEVLERVMSSKVSDNIEFIVKDYSVKEFYKRLMSFDILVLPYRSESQSGVLAHGFAAGTPAVVTDIEGLGAEIRNSNAGIAVKKRKNFHKAIVKLLKSKKLRKKYRENAKKYVKNVSGWPIIAKKTLEIYNKF